MSPHLQAGLCRESDPFPGRSQQPAGFADTLGAAAALLGTLDPGVQTSGNGPINCSGINQLQIFLINFLSKDNLRQPCVSSSEEKLYF